MLVGMIVFHGYSSTSWHNTVRTNMRHKTHLPKACNDRCHEPYRKNHRKRFCGVVMLKLNIGTNEQLSTTTENVTTATILIFTCRRANYLQDTLTDILSNITHGCSIGCPVIVSQGGKDESVAHVIASFQEQLPSTFPLLHDQHTSTIRKQNPYQVLAQHYGSDLQRVFTTCMFERVIILEEDLHVSPDSFTYFQAMAPIRNNDSSLLAVSAFHDNGFTGRVLDSTRVVRSDLFPRLGWIYHGDNWIREPAQRKKRHLVVMESSDRRFYDELAMAVLITHTFHCLPA